MRLTYVIQVSLTVMCEHNIITSITIGSPETLQCMSDLQPAKPSCTSTLRFLLTFQSIESLKVMHNRAGGNVFVISMY